MSLQDDIFDVEEEIKDSDYATSAFDRIIEHLNGLEKAFEDANTQLVAIKNGATALRDLMK